METQFEQRMHHRFDKSALICCLWILLFHGFYFITALPYHVSNLELPIHIVPLAFALLAMVFVCFQLLRRRYLVYILGALALVSMTCMAAMIHHATRNDAARAFSTSLSHVTRVVGTDPAAAEQLHLYVDSKSCATHFWLAFLIDFLVLDALPLGAFPRWFLLSYLLPSVSFALVAILSPHVQASIFTYVGSLVVAIYFICSRLSRAQQHYTEFIADYELQQTLSQEADEQREAHFLAEAQKCAAQKAESILNHILKNLMADAAGCIELSGQCPEDPNNSYLHRATDCLAQGMLWCKQRQALLSLAIGQYQPTMVPVHLQAFGAALLRSRPALLSGPNLVVRLDPVLCNIVLTNALDNAFRHGHPRDPGVAFTMALLPEGRRLKFCVSNNCHPDRPALPPKRGPLLLGTAPSPEEQQHRPPYGTSLSDHIGLEHVCLAAKAHGMDITLEQVGDRVIFKAVLETAAAPDPVPHPGGADKLLTTDEELCPDGLRVLCIDDSDVARRLLQHVLAIHGKAEVRVFGRHVGEVALFEQEALQGADVLVLDQHLDFPEVLCLGTDIVRRLIERGFGGLVCIRSANADGPDAGTYYDAGAHLVLGKDLSTRELVRRLRRAYAERLVASLGALTSSTAMHDGMATISLTDDDMRLLPGQVPSYETIPL